MEFLYTSFDLLGAGETDCFIISADDQRINERAKLTYKPSEGLRLSFKSEKLRFPAYANVARGRVNDESFTLVNISSISAVDVSVMRGFSTSEHSVEIALLSHRSRNKLAFNYIEMEVHAIGNWLGYFEYGSARHNQVAPLQEHSIDCGGLFKLGIKPMTLESPIPRGYKRQGTAIVSLQFDNDVHIFEIVEYIRDICMFFSFIIGCRIYPNVIRRGTIKSYRSIIAYRHRYPSLIQNDPDDTSEFYPNSRLDANLSEEKLSDLITRWFEFKSRAPLAYEQYEFMLYNKMMNLRRYTQGISLFEGLYALGGYPDKAQRRISTDTICDEVGKSITSLDLDKDDSREILRLIRNRDEVKLSKKLAEAIQDCIDLESGFIKETLFTKDAFIRKNQEHLSQRLERVSKIRNMLTHPTPNSNYVIPERIRQWNENVWMLCNAIIAKHLGLQYRIEASDGYPITLPDEIGYW